MILSLHCLNIIIISDKSAKALRDSVDKAVAKMNDIDDKIDSISRYIMKKQKRVLVRSSERNKIILSWHSTRNIITDRRGEEAGGGPTGGGQEGAGPGQVSSMTLFYCNNVIKM